MFEYDVERGTIDARGVVDLPGGEGFSSDDMLAALTAMNGRDVVMLLKSEGGLVTEGLSIHGMIERYPGKVTVEVDTLAASIATVMIMAADEIVMRRKARLMIHDPWLAAMGNASAFRNLADNLDALALDIAEVYAERSGKESARWLQAMRDETWYTASEAVDAGLADRVAGRVGYSDDDEIPARDPSVTPYTPTTSDDPNLYAPFDNVVAAVDLTVTDAMVDEAKRALEWREEYGRGGTQVGVTRANQIVNDGKLTAETWARVFSYLSRHQVDKEAEGFSPGEEGYPSPGRIAYGLWGGEPAFSRSRSIVEQLDNAEDATDQVDEPVAWLPAVALADSLDKRHRLMGQRYRPR